MENREIKFRAYETIRNKMYDWDYIAKSFNHWLTCEFSSLMQYTGINDKNGVEVYDGDILSVPNRLYEKDNKIIKGNSVVYFDYGMFKCNNISLCTFREFEVIGNIHENPELL
jgi:hypothetical protein